MRNLLITSAGKRVSLVKEFIAEYKNINKNAKVFAADAYPKLSSACLVADDCFEVPKINEQNYIETLIAKCKKHQIKLVIPTIDTELLVLAQNKTKFKNENIQVVVSSEEFILKCRDKRKIHRFFEENGVEVAQEYAKNKLEFPIFIKPYDGSRSVDTYLLKSESDLLDYHLKNDKLMFLEYLDHNYYDEYTCDLYYTKRHSLKCVVPRKRIEVRDGEVNKGITKKNELVNYIKQNLSYIKGAEGCITAQFFLNKKNKRIVAIEINPRFGGGFPLAYHAGANFPKWIIEEYLFNKEVPYFDNWEEEVLMLRYDQELIVKTNE